MGTYGTPKRVRRIATEDLPDGLVHVIFSKLDFESKVIAGLVCKRWLQLLKVTIAGARHWAIHYNIDNMRPTQPFMSTEDAPIVEQFNATMGRWLTNRAAAIKSVTVTVTLSYDQEGAATRDVLESQLPLLAGCLAKHVNRLTLSFWRGLPFAGPLRPSPASLTFLCPMVKRFNLWALTIPVTASHFAAICELTSLEELYIHAEVDEDELQELDELPGLQELTSDITKLVNLTGLIFCNNFALEDIPESISGLQKLEVLKIHGSDILEVPSGLARLANLTCFGFRDCGPLWLPPSLQGLKSLTSVELAACSLEKIPEVFSGLSTLTTLAFGGNNFRSSDGWSWWPTTLSRLTRLAELVIYRSAIVSLPPHISELRQLTRLDVSGNKLRRLPQQLSSLQKLRDLDAGVNHFPSVPVCVLSSLTALTCIHMSHQQRGGSGPFKIPSSLLPMLHPGLVKLDLRQNAPWDLLSLYHLGRAMAEVAERTSVPTLKYLSHH